MLLTIAWSLACVAFGAAFHASIMRYIDRARRAAKAASRELGDG